MSVVFTSLFCSACRFLCCPAQVGFSVAVLNYVLRECWSVVSYYKEGDGDQRVKSQREDSLTDRVGVVEGSALGGPFPRRFLSVY